ncbi:MULTISPECIES: DUF6701 domain-containing protein [unclassified Pseudomonas]|uniref:DUF6701 domain-containing protein n=4 Tax=Pseudomonas TaxID=286 RepID=UPI002B233D69|nr:MULTISPECIES: DUF6701 domain-containing protein [unclassified Pseudomonas]MEA9994219.1 hypothetical protein [Pseudomonas sp. AA4]MEB0086146.1 hypothetical protein [Pseudomonas sp. RTI1]MEB0124934.1 hypothetical protein [Pseudomonas sp. CCC1.2]MEB0153663.1 hypothetical protein [Pseudomonas sp. CCC4.3]MEB0217693.1 hypothetical protein [Pseudomonas sp. AB12(2023)]
MSKQVVKQSFLWGALLGGLLLTNTASAATAYSFSLLGTNAPCTGLWSSTGNTFTCTGKVILATGDSLVVGTLIVGNITVVANQGFSLDTNTIGTSGSTIDLVSTAGAIDVAGTKSTFSGSINSTAGTITLSGANVAGSVQTTNGTMTLAGSNIGGSVQAGGAITATTTKVNGNVISTSGAGTLAAVTVGGYVKASGAITLKTGSAITGSVTSTGGALTLSDSSVGADVLGYGAATSSDTAIKGNLTSSTGAITIVRGSIAGSVVAEGAITSTGAPINGSVTSHSGAITLTGGSVGGDIKAFGVVTMTDTPITGNINTQAAATLVRGSVSGDVIAAAVITTTDTCVGGNVQGGAAMTLTRTSVGVSVQSKAAMTLTGSTIIKDALSGAALTATDTCIGGTTRAVGALSITGGCNTSPAHTYCSAPAPLPPVAAIDHFAFSYAGTALTCNPQPVTITACATAGCSPFTDPVSIALSPASGWTAAAPAVMNGNTITFSGGSAQAYLSIGSAGNVSVGVSSSVPGSNGQTVCSTSGCTIAYADSGFIFTVPTLITGRPQSGISLRAVKKSDTSQACVPGFSNVTRNLNFSSTYVSPVSGSQPVIVNNTAVTSAPTRLSLVFDSTGSAPLTVRYDDAGQMMLTATYLGSTANNDAGLSMNGSDLFVSKPYGLCIQTDSVCTVAGVSSDCKAFPGVRAGDNFPIRIQAVGWLADGDPLTAASLCSGRIIASNFQLPNIPLASLLVAPAAGDSGILSPTQYNQVLGNQTTATTSISEVGVFQLTATPAANAYFGETVSGGRSGLVGRFTPAFLGVQGSASLTQSCGTSFSYQGQPMAFAVGHEPNLIVTAFNRNKGITHNYDRDAFWRLSIPVRDAYTSITGKTSVDVIGRLTNSATATVAQSGANNGDGAESFRWSGDTLQYTPAALPLADDFPFTAAIRQRFSAATLTDADGACFGDGTTCTAYSYDFSNTPGSQVRLGRLRLGNAHGSELQVLTLPLSLETWQNIAGGSFQTEGLDTCTAAVLQTPTLTSYTGQLTPANYANSNISMIAPNAGVGLLKLQPPGISGSVLGSLPATPSWLLYDWNGTGRQAATGVARFGIYQGPSPMIFRRENYR